MNLNDYLNMPGVSQSSLAEEINKDAGLNITQGRISQMTKEGVPGDRWSQFIRCSKGSMTYQSLAEERERLRSNKSGAAA